MKFLYKHMKKELLKHRGMIVILFFLVFLTSFMYFFVHFSIDDNIKNFNDTAIKHLDMTSHLGKYYIALQNNTALIRNVTISLVSINFLVLLLFLKNFIRKNESSIGNFMVLGFSTPSIISSFIRFIFILSFIASLLGLFAGYLSSDILIHANETTYSVSGLNKGIDISTFLKGILLLPGLYCLLSYITCLEIDKKDPALKMKKGYLIQKQTLRSTFIDTLINIVPIKEKFKLRIALKNVNSLFLLLIAIMTFNIMFILGVSLFFSIGKIHDSQTLHHNYTYTTSYKQSRDISKASNEIFYLKTSGKIIHNKQKIDYTIMGLDKTNKYFHLVDTKDKPIKVPKEGIILNPELSENYNIHIGDTVTVRIKNISFNLKVTSIAANAHLKTIYIPKNKVAHAMNVEQTAYNGVLSHSKHTGGITLTQKAKISELEQSSTSNKASAIINQSIGITVGILLIVLAMLIAFNNNIQHMLIFDLLGYSTREINTIVLNSFFTILNVLFIITFVPSLYVARKIQSMTSIQTGDYMPFQINSITVLYIVIVLNLIYFSVRYFFGKRTQSVIRTERQNEILT